MLVNSCTFASPIYSAARTCFWKSPSNISHTFAPFWVSFLPGASRDSYHIRGRKVETAGSDAIAFRTLGQRPFGCQYLLKRIWKKNNQVCCSGRVGRSYKAPISRCRNRRGRLPSGLVVAHDYPGIRDVAGLLLTALQTAILNS